MATLEELSAGAGIVAPATGSSRGASTKFSPSDADIAYDNPFMDMTSTYLPCSIKKMFKVIAAYLFGDPLISTIITKLSEYPITDLVYDEWDTSLKTKEPPEQVWKNILEKYLDLRKQLIISGGNYYGYGNSYMSLSFPFNRILECKNCHKKTPVGAVKKLTYTKNQYHGKCSKCNSEVDFDFEDALSNDLAKLRVIHWDVANVDVKFNNITSESFYYYTIPTNIKDEVKKGDMDIVNSTPKDVLIAIKNNKRVKLNKNNLFHLKREHVSYLYPGERGYGIPAVLPVIKSVFHNQILKKGNEMVAFEHIIPLRIMFPQQQGEISPHLNMDLGLWKQKIEAAIKEWRRDKNQILTVPQPVGVQLIGGDGRALMTTQELKLNEDDIIVGMGMIPEIIRGGASWSGTNVSLRIVENGYLNHRSDMQRAIDFFVDQISTKYDIARIKVRLSNFKMADDSQQKQIIMRAASGSPSDAILSHSTAIKELGYDPEEEYENKKKDLKRALDIRMRDLKSVAKAQGEASLVNAIFNAKASIEHQNRLELGERQSYEKRMKADQERMGENAEQVGYEVSELAQRDGINEQEVSVPDLIMRITEKAAVASRTHPEEFKAIMLNMKNSTPALYQEVYNNLREMNLIKADLVPDISMAQDKTPGEIPQYVQGDKTATDPPSMASAPATPGIAGADTSKVREEAAIKPNPEAAPPRRDNPSI